MSFRILSLPGLCGARGAVGVVIAAHVVLQALLSCRAWCRRCCRRATHGVTGAVVGLRGHGGHAMLRAVSQSLLSQRVNLSSRSRSLCHILLWSQLYTTCGVAVMIVVPCGAARVS
jgi:hypothetical protein